VLFCFRVCTGHAAQHLFFCRYGGGHYYAYCRPNDGEQWVEFNDSSVHPNLNPNSVITGAAYVLFFRRVYETPRTLANLMSSDERCQEGSAWIQELESEPEGGSAAGGRAAGSE
jgi:ubiquitin carboxyl-terminal hydrolase 4/11/15